VVPCAVRRAALVYELAFVSSHSFLWRPSQVHPSTEAGRRAPTLNRVPREWRSTMHCRVLLTEPLCSGVCVCKDGGNPHFCLSFT
jgi:hypothetical protein